MRAEQFRERAQLRLERLGAADAAPARDDHARLFEPRLAARLAPALDDARARVPLNVERGARRLARRLARRRGRERASAQPHDRRHALQRQNRVRLAAVDLPADANRIALNTHLDAVTRRAPAQAVRQPRRKLLTVSVVPEQHGARLQLPADLRERRQVSLRLILAQLRLICHDHGVRDPRDLGGDRPRPFAQHHGAQAHARRLRQTPPRARQPLRALIESVRREKYDENVVHDLK